MGFVELWGIAACQVGVRGSEQALPAPVCVPALGALVKVRSIHVAQPFCATMYFLTQAGGKGRVTAQGGTC